MKNLLKLSAMGIMLFASTTSVFAQENKSFPVKGFNSISVSSGIDLYLTQGGSESVNIKAESEILKEIEVEQSGGNLSIRMKSGINWGSMFKNRVIKAYVNYKTLAALSASGGSDVFTQNTIKTDKFSIHASGGSDLKLDLVCTDLELSTSGGSDLDLKGKADNMILKASGGSDIDAYELITQYAKASVSGGSDVNINVSKALEASASGGGDIHFKGDAALKKTSSSKSGDVTRVK